MTQASKVPNASGWWLRRNEPCYVKQGREELYTDRDGEAVVDDGTWQGPIRCGTVVEGGVPTEAQHERLKYRRGFWLVAAHGVAFTLMPDVDGLVCNGEWFPYVYWERHASSIWHAKDECGYPLDLEVKI